MKLGTVSLEKFTNRRAPAAIAASNTLKVLIVLLPKTTCGGLHGLRDGSGVDDDLKPRARRTLLPRR